MSEQKDGEQCAGGEKEGGRGKKQRKEGGGQFGSKKGKESIEGRKNEWIEGWVSE